MSIQTKVATLLAGVLVLILGMVAVGMWQARDDKPVAVESSTGSETRLVRDDSRIMGEEGKSGVTVVEFLDFECEGCRAAYPLVEDLRKKYAGQVTFIARYFPLPGHFNAERAARAVEAAARQGQFEAMYQRMYETQAEWGEQQVPLDDTFRVFANDIGLDLQKFDVDYASDEVAARVQRDVADGQALGVQGTPTFYLDGQPLQLETAQDFYDAIDEALARQ